MENLRIPRQNLRAFRAVIRRVNSGLHYNSVRILIGNHTKSQVSSSNHVFHDYFIRLAYPSNLQHGF